MVAIEWYEGAKAEERPRALVVDGIRLAVDEVLEDSEVFDATTGGNYRLIKVRCGERYFRIKEDLQSCQCDEERMR